MRLSQFIAHHSGFSRREADELIRAGRIKVGSKKAVLGQEVSGQERIFLDGKMLKIQKFSTVIIYHKPKGELVSKRDDRGRRVIFDSLDKKFGHFTPVGRLDYVSEGLLLLSDDKKIAHALMHSDLLREYIIKIHAPITQRMIEAMQNGLKLEDARAGGHAKSKIQAMEFAPFHSFSISKNQRNFSRLKVVISEGKNRELRRFFAHFKAEVLDLRRTGYGFFNLSSLPVGKWRYLSRQEYRRLHEFMASQEPARLQKSELSKSAKRRMDADKI